jgi:polysaccharide export outer membrane protein
MKQQLSRLGWITFTALLIAGPMSAQINPARESLLIGAGDQVHISVFREPDLDTKARVTDAGDITLPLVGSLHVAGLNPAQAASAIAKLYEADHFLKSAQVSLLIDEYATQTVSIVGEVQKPGSYPISTPRSVMDAIAAAGGLTPSADRHITIEHRGEVVEKQEVFLPNNANDTLAAQVKVYPGDLIVVPKEGIVYVLGDVGKPGGYTMDDDSKITVLQAVAMASGANHTAVEGHVRLVRRTPQGASTEITISLSAMQKGKIPDMPLQANDVLWVPFSYGKNFAVNGSTILGVAGSAAVYHY